MVAVYPGPVIRLTSDSPPQIIGEYATARPLSLIEDRAGTIWLSSVRGEVWQITQQTSRQLTAAEGLPENSSECILAQDNTGRIWFYKGNEFGFIRDGRFETIGNLSEPGSIAPAKQGGMWVGSNFKLYHCDESGQLQNCGSFKPAFPSGRILTLLDDGAGAVWIGTSASGLFRYHEGNFDTVPTSYHRITSLLEDNECNLWVGTQSGGINRVQPRTISVDGPVTGFAADVVMSLCQDAGGTLWAAMQDGSLKRRMDGAWTPTKLSEAPTGGYTCVAADQTGALWIGTRANRLICSSDQGLKTISSKDGLMGRTISKIHAARNGDLWIAEQTPDTLQRLRQGKFREFPLPLEVDHIRTIAEGSGGQIWVASENGKLWRIVDDEVITDTQKLPASAGRILCLYPADDGTVWIGTQRSGVVRFKGGVSALIDSKAGVFDNCISQIISDRHGWFWFGSSKGIFRVREEELQAVADNRKQRLVSIHYDEGEGLPALHATAARSNALAAADGRLWMIMGTALVAISPDNVREITQPPPIVVEQVLVDDSQVAAYGGVVPVVNGLDLTDRLGELSLPPDYHRLQFDFTALSFTNPSNVQFQYKLNGFEEQWNDAGIQRVAKYPRLPAAEYRFVVRACNSDGVWNTAGSEVRFSIEPFLTQTWWFRTLAVVAFSALLLMTGRYIWFRRLRRKLAVIEQRAALDRERHRIARDIHDDLGCGLTRIVLLSELSLQEHNGFTDSHICQISSTAKQQIKSLDETVWAINPSNDTLPNLINYVAQFMVRSLDDAEIACKLDLPDDPPDIAMPAEVRHNIFMVAKEAINNILRHSHATEAGLTIAVDREELSIAIFDNGSGFAVGPAEIGEDGLANMRQRMNDIGAAFDVATAPGRGTRISISYSFRIVSETPS